MTRGIFHNTRGGSWWPIHLQIPPGALNMTTNCRVHASLHFCYPNPAGWSRQSNAIAGFLLSSQNLSGLIHKMLCISTKHKHTYTFKWKAKKTKMSCLKRMSIDNISTHFKNSLIYFSELHIFREPTRHISTYLGFRRTRAPCRVWWRRRGMEFQYLHWVLGLSTNTHRLILAQQPRPVGGLLS